MSDEVTMHFEINRMSNYSGKEKIKLVIDPDGIHVFLQDNREFWIEVNDEGSLMVRGYRCMEDERYKTMTIDKDEILIS